jgi:hypothetical protein
MDIPNVPTEMVCSWVGQGVTVPAYSASAPTIPAAGTPEVVPETEPRESHHGRILHRVE